MLRACCFALFMIGYHHLPVAGFRPKEGGVELKVVIIRYDPWVFDGNRITLLVIGLPLVDGTVGKTTLLSPAAYPSSSLIEACPVMAAISQTVHPISARSEAVVLRIP